jgi:hypothetical protein
MVDLELYPIYCLVTDFLPYGKWRVCISSLAKMTNCHIHLYLRSDVMYILLRFRWHVIFIWEVMSCYIINGYEFHLFHNRSSQIDIDDWYYVYNFLLPVMMVYLTTLVTTKSLINIQISPECGICVEWMQWQWWAFMVEIREYIQFPICFIQQMEEFLFSIQKYIQMWMVK